MKQQLYLSLSCLSLLFAGCDKGGQTFSLLGASQNFRQDVATNRKVDIVWIVDGSGTMANHQANLARNFQNFIQQFSSRGIDYQMVVASTDAWVREVNYNGGGCQNNPNPSMSSSTRYISSADCRNTRATYRELAEFRDGDIYGQANGTAGARSGTYLLSSAMSQQDVDGIFRTNVSVGTRGDGTRESAFQSLRAVLRRDEAGLPAYNGETQTVLSQFRRPDAFLAVIIVSDEEDQGLKANGSPYANVQEYTDSFISFLEAYTGSSANDRRYSVSGIVLEDLNNCSYGLHDQATQGDRYVGIANVTRGIIGNICSPDFSSQLTDISERIISLTTRFRLNREPYPASIRVAVNGMLVNEDSVNGWTYIKESDDAYFIEFHGNGIPPEGSEIMVVFDPTTVQF